MAVVVVEVSADGVLQFAGAAVDATAQLLFGKQREPALDQVEPGAAGGREVQMEARMTQQPALDRLRSCGCRSCPGSGAGPARRAPRRRWFQESLRNSTVRWRRWNSPITVPALASSAANRLMVP